MSFRLKKILFVNPGHIKSITDIFAYCNYLKNKYDITYIGYDEHQESYKIDGVEIIYIKGYGNNFINKLKFFKLIITKYKNNNYDFIFLLYFKGVSLLNILGLRNANLDIRSSCIHRNKLNRLFFNKLITLESLFFSKITVISLGLKKFLDLPPRSLILPLGADLVKKQNKTFGFKLLYVGTFHERNISNTILAFSKFINENNISSKNDVTYTIIGNGTEHEISLMTKTIIKNNMSDFVKYLGVIRYPELSEYFLKHNVGISYIPIRSHFNFQPPTKTFEYLLNGLIVIATKTYEHEKVINDSNGVIVNDSISDFSNGINEVYKNFNKFNFKKIQESSSKYCWGEIITKYLIPIIESE